jgi:hypothetical protein
MWEIVMYRGQERVNRRMNDGKMFIRVIRALINPPVVDKLIPF